MKFLKDILKDGYTVLIFRVVVGVVFVYASLDKIANPEDFAKIIYGYKILPSFLINLVAITLPWIELICGLFLIGGIFVESSSLVIFFLLVVFIMGTSLNVFIRGIDINCGCFTTSLTAKKSGAELVLREIILLLMSLQIFLFNRDFATLPGFYRKIFSRWLLK